MGLRAKNILWMVSGKCPKCGGGKLFKNGFFSFKKITVMNSECSVCKTDFQREPGFYFGAAYVSYGITVALWVAVFVALYVFNEWGLVEFTFMENPVKLFVTGLVVLVILIFPIYRLSRSLWLGMFSIKKKN